MYGGQASYDGGQRSRATRRFARRQHGWFGKDDRIGWVPFDADDRLERALTYHRRS